MADLEAGVRIDRLAKKLGLGADKVARDMLQVHLLGAMFAKTTERELVLKGGYALRAGPAQSERFTKDIDMQSGQASMARVRSIMKQAIDETLKSGLLQDAVVSEPKQTETVQRWKIGGKVGQSDVNLTIEVSRRGAPSQSDVERTLFTPDPDTGAAPYEVETLNPTAIAAGKVMALVSPMRLAPRDLFDLDLLIKMEVTPPVELLARVGVDELKRALTVLWDKLELHTWDQANSELIQFLPTRISDKVDQETWETMRLSVGETVERWLKDAIAIGEAQASERDLETSSGMAP